VFSVFLCYQAGGVMRSEYVPHASLFAQTNVYKLKSKVIASEVDIQYTPVQWKSQARGRKKTAVTRGVLPPPIPSELAPMSSAVRLNQR
jgi:hypothetical protein